MFAVIICARNCRNRDEILGKNNYVTKNLRENNISRLIIFSQEENQKHQILVRVTDFSIFQTSI